MCLSWNEIRSHAAAFARKREWPRNKTILDLLHAVDRIANP